MPTSKAQQKANRKWNENNLDRLYVSVPKGLKKVIEEAAKANNQSVNAFVKMAIQKQLEK